MHQVSDQTAVVWGSIIGFGYYTYRTDSGHAGESFLTGFAPRKANMVVYVMTGFQDLQQQLERLALARGYTVVRAPDGRLLLVETRGAPGTSPAGRSHFQLPPDARRILDPAAFGLGPIPAGFVPYQTPAGTILLVKNPRGASKFASPPLNEK